MKLSNIILTAFSVLFIVYLFGVCAEIRLRGEKKNMFSYNPVQRFEEKCSSNYKTKIPLPSFKVLKINKISQSGLVVLGENRNTMFTVFGDSEKKIPNLEYHKSGDTLIIDKMNGTARCKEFKLELGESGPELIIDSMSVTLACKTESLNRLSLKGSNASFIFSDIDTNFKFMDSLDVDLKNNSSFRSSIQISVKHVAGKVSKHSEMDFWSAKVKSAEVEIGEHSRIIIEGKRYDNPDPSAQLIYRKLNQEDSGNQPGK